MNSLQIAIIRRATVIIVKDGFNTYPVLENYPTLNQDIIKNLSVQAIKEV